MSICCQLVCNIPTVASLWEPTCYVNRQGPWPLEYVSVWKGRICLTHLKKLTPAINYILYLFLSPLLLTQTRPHPSSPARSPKFCHLRPAGSRKTPPASAEYLLLRTPPPNLMIAEEEEEEEQVERNSARWTDLKTLESRLNRQHRPLSKMRQLIRALPSERLFPLHGR